MNTKVLAFVLAAGTALTFTAGAQAADRSDAGLFCGSIGLSAGNQIACTKQLQGASNENDRRAVQATWVARSGMVNGTNNINARVPAGSVLPHSTTHYQSAVRFVPNRIVADINRAKNSVRASSELTTQAVAAERSYRTTDFAN